jgi:hypothetical protein
MKKRHSVGANRGQLRARLVTDLAKSLAEANLLYDIDHDGPQHGSVDLVAIEESDLYTAACKELGYDLGALELTAKEDPQRAEYDKFRRTMYASYRKLAAHVKKHKVGKSGGAAHRVGRGVSVNTKESFETAAKGLPFFGGIDLSAEVVRVEPIDSSYFRDSSRQRCIIRRKDGKLYLAPYE